MKKKELSIWGSDFCVIDDNIYIFHGSINALFRVSMADGVVSFVAKVDFEMMNQRALFLAMAERNHKIYLFPYNANNFICYDTKTNKIRKIAEKKYKITNVIGTGRYIYLQPAIANEPIIKFDLDREECIKEIFIIDKNSKLQYYFNDICTMENGIYAIILVPGNIVCFINSMDDSTYTIRILDDEDMYASLEYYDGYLYAIGKEKYFMVKIEPKSGKIVEKYKLFNDYGRIIGKNKQDLIVDMAYKSEIYTFDCVDKKISVYGSQYTRKSDNQYYEWCYGILKKCSDECVYYLNRYNNTISRYYKNSEETLELKVLDTDYIKIKNKTGLNMAQYEVESELLNLEDYLKNI